MRKQRLREVVWTCPRSHRSWASWPKQFDSRCQAIFCILNCSPKLGFRKVKRYVKDHRSVSTEPGPRAPPHIGLYSRHVVIFAQSPSEANVSHLCHHPGPVWVCSAPSSNFPVLYLHLFHGYPCSGWGQTLSSLAPNPHPVFRHGSRPVVCCGSDTLIIVLAARERGNPQIHLLPSWLPTF